MFDSPVPSVATTGVRSSTPKLARGHPAALAPCAPKDRPEGYRSADEWPCVSHEVLTPLHGLLGSIGVLVEGAAGPLSPQARACLGEAQLAGHHLNHRVRSLLLLVQVLMSDRPLQEARVDLIEAVQIAMRKSGHCSRRLKTEPANARLVIRADPFWCDALAHALVELLTQAPQGMQRPRFADARLSLQLPEREGDGAIALALLLIGEILRRHDGEVLHGDGDAMALIWPQERIITATP